MYMRFGRPATPFIYVSGTLGEELAIERLKDGAVDYVLKPYDDTRLLAAIDRGASGAYNVADDEPVRRGGYAGTLATLIGAIRLSGDLAEEHDRRAARCGRRSPRCVGCRR